MGVKVTATRSLDMTAFDFSNLAYGTPTIFTGTTYQLSYSDGLRDVFKGTGFQYNADHVPIAGTVKSLTEYIGSSRYFAIEGVSISAKSIVKAASTSSRSDDADILITALKGNDTILGSNQDDLLFGAGGHDLIKGNGGRDWLLSGPGADDMYGGSGTDVFVFTHKAHSTVSATGRDTIFDFTSADKIDLSVIDAKPLASGNNPFSFIGTKGFSGKAGELRYQKMSSDTYIYGDINGDKAPDFAIHLDDAITMKSGYFFL